MQVLTWDGQLLALELPQTVDTKLSKPRRVLKARPPAPAPSQPP